MTSLPDAAAALLLQGDGAIHLGPMRLTPYGACAAVGLVLAMALARRCARGGGLDPERVWDAGVFAIVSCFVASRLLLVLFDVKAFLRYPLLVLSLPSLTLGGMVIAAGMVAVHLKSKRLPWRRVLDVYAAPAALLASWLELGHALDGSELGMPLSFKPDGDVARFHPVSVYGVIVSALLAAVLWRVLLWRRPAGSVTALALVAGGAAAFGLDMLTQPSILFDGWWLEPGQVIALASMGSGSLLWAFRCVQDGPGSGELPLKTLEEERETVRVDPVRTDPAASEVH